MTSCSLRVIETEARASHSSAGNGSDADEARIPGSRSSYRGAVYHQSGSTKFTRLSTVAGVFEYEVDADGNNLSTTHRP